MNDGQAKVAQMGVNAQAFVETKASLFQHSAATVVDTMFAQTKSKLDNAIAALGGKQAIEIGGGFDEGTGAKSTRRNDLWELLRDTNRTAGAIAKEKSEPEILERFRMLHGNRGEELKMNTPSMTQACQMSVGLIKRPARSRRAGTIWRSCCAIRIVRRPRSRKNSRSQTSWTSFAYRMAAVIES